MKNTKSIGDHGEKIAKDFLKNLDYTILEQNYRYKKGEIDIICENENTLVFVEVKYRSSTQFGYPEDVVNNTKTSLIQGVAEHYIEIKDWKKDIRFDIVSVIENKHRYDIEHFIDAF